MARYLITSALPYINGVKHLGNLAGSMLPADAYARYQRARGHEVLAICATDEHGTPAELAAAAAGMEVADYCAEQYRIQRDVGDRFGLAWDHFGRSSSVQNRELTQHFAQALRANGLLEDREIEQVYSIDDDRFLPDRYVIGTCPHCGYDSARGDQCEHCTRLLDPTVLIDPRSAVSGTTRLERRKSRHIFFRQSQLGGRIREWIDAQAGWPVLTTSIARKWLDEGLEDRDITRDLTWGVPVNQPGFEGKVFYVWFDAPIEYIGATREWADVDVGSRDWKSWWYEAGDVTHVQFMAKDNVPFHTVMWPSTIMGSGEPWKLADFIKSFNWLTYYGGKFSTSQRRGIFMDAAADLLPADYWRYWLLANAPESDDSNFTWSAFATGVNKDLAGIYGNFVQRTLKLCASRLGASVPAGGSWGEDEDRLSQASSAALSEYQLALEDMRFRAAAFALRSLWVAGNQYLDRTAPWHLEDQAHLGAVLRTAINLIRVEAIVSAPVLPFSSVLLFDALKLDDAEQRWPGGDLGAELRRLEPGRRFDVPGALFPRLGREGRIDEWVAGMETRFGA